MTRNGKPDAEVMDNLVYNYENEEGVLMSNKLLYIDDDPVVNPDYNDISDAQGNIMATYTWEGSNSPELQQQYIYGSQRLGYVDREGLSTPQNIMHAIGLKKYELSNHLGNVLVTISDRPVSVVDESNTFIEGYTADIVSAGDYYPYGSLMPGRNYSPDNYRFGFNGQEKVNEVAGVGNSYTAEFWQYDSRLGRRWNQDPKPNPSISNYACFANNPIFFTDPLGDTIRTNQEGFNVINEGLTATLGEGHGFSYNKDKGIVNYNAVEGKEYTKDQQNIINRYTKLINDEKSTNVTIVDHNEGIGILGGKSLADYGFNGVTVTPTDFSSFNVFIARNPKEVGQVANPAYNPFKEDGTPATIPGFVNTNTYYRGVASVHEIGGHAYLRLTQPKLEQASHNTLVENFETNFRQFYKIGTYTKKREVKRARKRGLDVQIGSPKYLGGSADKH